MSKKLTKKEQFILAMDTADHNAEAYNEMTNLCASRPDSVTFYQWVKETDWTLDAIIAFFRYHCKYYSGGTDWQEFENYYECFKPRIYECFN